MIYPLAQSDACSCEKVKYLAPTITFITSLVAIILCLIYTTKYLAIMGGCGCLASLCMCSMVSDLIKRIAIARQIVRLKQEVDRLQAANDQLFLQIGVLEGQLKRFSASNTRLEGNILILEGNLSNAKTSIDELSRNVAGMKEENVNLTKIKNDLEVQVKETKRLNDELIVNLEAARAQYNIQLERLTALNGSLEKMRDNSSIKFNELISSFTRQIEAFGSENEKLKADHAVASQTATLLEAILKRVGEWEQDATKAKLIGEIDQLSTLRAKISEEVGACREQVRLFREENEKLRLIKDSFMHELERFEHQNEVQGRNNQEMSRIQEVIVSRLHEEVKDGRS